MPANSVPRQEAHGQMLGFLMMFHRLLAEVVALWEAVQRQAGVAADGVAREQRHQDGFHHDHGHVLAHAGTGA